jgi:hypothetical protein
MTLQAVMAAPPDPDVWAIVELMGHVKLAGKLTEVERFGAKMGRLDIPQADGSYVTQFFGGGSIYRITPVSEEVARHVVKSTDPAPVQAWDFPKQLDARRTEDQRDNDDWT